MENDPKPQKRGRKPKIVKTEEPIAAENVIIEEKQDIQEEKDGTIDEIPEAIEPPSEDEMSTVEEPKEPIKIDPEEVEKREEVIEEIKETVVEEIKEAVEIVTEEIVVNNNLEIKSLLNLLIIISVRPDMQEKYGLKPELVKTLQLIIQNNSSFFFKIEESFKKILEDNKIDSDDVPELMSLFSSVYELLFSLKLKTRTIEMSNICGELIKLTFNIMLTESLIIFETVAGNEETLKTFNALVDSSISLIKLSKTVKFSNKCCVIW